jgi:hypothetical protein
LTGIKRLQPADATSAVGRPVSRQLAIDPNFKRHFAIFKQVLIYERVLLRTLDIFTALAKCLISLKKLVRVVDPRGCSA